MSIIIKKIKSLIIKYNRIIKYGLISVFVTLVDIFISKSLDKLLSPVVANTIGVIVGFIIQYFISSKVVFNKTNKKVFIIYITTFVLGLFLANSIVYLTRTFFEANNYFSYNQQFYLGKAASIVIPFFGLYLLRKKMIE